MGKQDELIFADSLLQSRIKASKERRAKMIQSNVPGVSPYPSLNEIEETHILFTNIKCKPFVKMAMEYSRTPKSNVSLSSQVDFDIPQFGDFFSDMVVHVVIDKITADVAGSNSTTPDVALVRYCDYPGERLFQSVSFTVNSSPLDEIYQEVYPMTRQFRVSQDKLAGWKRSMGQSEPHEGVYMHSTTISAGAQERQLHARVSDGYQTYKQQQPALELFVPLLFWFCDIRQAVPSAAIPVVPLRFQI